MLHKASCTNTNKRLLCTAKKKIIRAGTFEKKVFLPNPNRQKLVIPQPPPKAPSSQIKPGPRINELGIQMLPKALHEQIFRNAKTNLVKPTKAFIEKCRLTLEKHNMVTKDSDYVKDVDFKLPPLEGKNLLEHFEIIAERQSEPYLKIVRALLAHETPAPPGRWLLQEGWTRYGGDGQVTHVAYPDEDGLVFDVEVCVRAGKAPTLATAVGAHAWYGWVSGALIEGVAQPVTGQEYPIDGLIALGEEAKPRVVVGHNVSYDRARVKEQYFLERTGARFVEEQIFAI